LVSEDDDSSPLVSGDDDSSPLVSGDDDSSSLVSEDDFEFFQIYSVFVVLTSRKKSSHI